MLLSNDSGKMARLKVNKKDFSNLPEEEEAGQGKHKRTAVLFMMPYGCPIKMSGPIKKC